MSILLYNTHACMYIENSTDCCCPYWQQTDSLISFMQVIENKISKICSVHKCILKFIWSYYESLEVYYKLSSKVTVFIVPNSLFSATAQQGLCKYKKASNWDRLPVSFSWTGECTQQHKSSIDLRLAQKTFCFCSSPGHSRYICYLSKHLKSPRRACGCTICFGQNVWRG